MRRLTTRRLTPERIAQAYPVIRMAMPNLSFEAWCRFAEEQIADDEPPRGLVTGESEQDYIVGLGAYRLERDLQDDRVLIANHFVAVDLIRREVVAETLAQELESVAKQHRCSALHTCLPGRGTKTAPNWLVELMASRGHTVDKLNLRKCLTGDD